MYSPDSNSALLEEKQWRLDRLKDVVRNSEVQGIDSKTIQYLYAQIGEGSYEIRSMRNQVKGDIKSPAQKIIVGYLEVYPELMSQGEEKTVSHLCEKFDFKGARTRRNVRYLSRMNCLPQNTA